MAFDIASFKLPNRSKFEKSFDVDLTTSFGRIFPIANLECVPGTTTDFRIQDLVRFMPMTAPVLSNFKLDTWAFFVPYRVLDPDHIIMNPEKYFNMQNFGKSYPSVESLPVFSGDIYRKLVGFGYKSSLFDYLRYQSPIPYLKYYRDIISSYSSGVITSSLSGFMTNIPSSTNRNTVSHLVDTKPLSYDDFGWYGNFSITNVAKGDVISDNVTISAGFPISSNGSRSLSCLVPTFRTWLLFKAYGFILSYTSIKGDASISPYDLFYSISKTIVNKGTTHVSLYRGSSSVYNESGSYFDLQKFLSQYFLTAPTIDSMCNMLGSTSDQLMRDYISEMIGFIASKDPEFLKDVPLQSVMDIMAYWRIMRDWFIPTNIVNPSQFYGDTEQFSIVDSSSFLHWVRNILKVPGSVNSINSPVSWIQPMSRYWRNDYFTSANPTPQSGNEVKIPANGTIRDLRTASRLQEVFERSMYGGNRYIDQIKAFFGITSSNARFDMSIPLGHTSTYVGIQDVLQTSQSDVNSSLGQYAGKGVGVSGDHLMHYTPEEHGFIMILGCVMPSTGYVGTSPRHLFKTSQADYLIPELENVGDQPIYDYELGPFGSGIFGYQRRYSEYMFEQSSVHGDFLDSLDYWTANREFQSKPSLDKNFLSVTDSDNLNRIFAVTSESDPVICCFHFDGYQILPLSRYISYSL